MSNPETSFSITCADLQTAIQPLATLCADIPPILNHSHACVAPDGVVFFGTNLSEKVRLLADAQPGVPGNLLLPTRKIAAIVRELDPQALLTFETDAAGWLDITVKDASLRYHMPVLPHEEYPDPPDLSACTWHQVPTEQLLSLIRAVGFAVSTEKQNSNPAMEGLYLKSEDTEPPRLVAVGTNGHRLAHAFTIPPQAGPDTPLNLADIISRRGAQVVCGLLRDQPRTQVTFLERNGGSRMLAFRQAHVTVSLELLGGQYPNYTPLLTSAGDYTYQVEFDHDALTASLRRVSRMVADRKQGIDFTFRPQGGLALSVEHDSGAAQDELETQNLTPLAEPHTIRLNPVYLMDALQHLLHGAVQIHFNDDRTPVRFLSTEMPDATYIVMPIDPRKTAA